MEPKKLFEEDRESEWELEGLSITEPAKKKKNRFNNILQKVKD